MADVYVNGNPDAFAVTSRSSQSLVIIAVSGELDLEKVELLDQAIQEAETEYRKRIVIDLRELSFIDSVGLSLLCEARRRCERIRFVPSDHDEVGRLIALTGTSEALGYPLTGGPAD